MGWISGLKFRKNKMMNAKMALPNPSKTEALSGFMYRVVILGIKPQIPQQIIVILAGNSHSFI
jgi:hypothetical protein